MVGKKFDVAVDPALKLYNEYNSGMCLLLPVRLSGERPGGKPSGPCGV